MSGESKYHTAAETIDKSNEAKRKAEERLRNACRRLFSTDDGRIVANAMMQVSGIYRLNKIVTDLGQAGQERGKEYMYLFFVKGMLTADELSHIERKDKQEDTDG